MPGMGPWMMIVWALLLLAVLAAAVVGIVVLVRRWNSPGSRPGHGEGRAVESPQEVLRRRYATGEIDEEEYHRRMSGLSQD